jgi:hypothetical protein
MCGICGIAAARGRADLDRADAVERLIDDPSSRREDMSRRLSGLLAFTLWYEHHVERTPTTPSNSLLQGVLA